MAQLLRFDGIDDHVTGSAISSVTTVTNFAVEIDFVLPAAAQADKKMYRLGGTGSSDIIFMIGPQSDGTVRLFARRNSSGSGPFILLYTPVLMSGVRYLIRAEVNTGTGACSISVNGGAASVGTIPSYSSGSFTTTRFIGTETVALGFCRMDLYGLKEFVDGAQVSNYNPSVSSGTVLVDLVNSANNGTIVNGAPFVYYNSITTTGVPNNTLGAALNQACAINLNNYFTGATSYTIQSGSLPAGLSISGNQIVGTPTVAQTATLVIRASNSIDLLDSATITFKAGLWFLRFDGVDDRINIPVVTLGVNDYVEVVITNYTGKSGAYHFLMDDDSETSRLFFGIRTTNRIEIPTETTALVNGAPVANNDLFTSVMNGADHTIRLTNNSGTKRVGRIGSRLNGVETWLGGIKSVVFSIGGSVTRYYDPNTSGGTGNLLIDRVSNQNGTQAGTWPADDSEWVFYSSGNSEIAVSGTLPRLTASISLSQAAAANQAAINGTMPRLTGAIALQSQVPASSMSVSGALPKLIGSIALVSELPAAQIAVAGILPKLTGAVSLSNIAAPAEMSVAGTLPRLTASIALNIPGVYPVANASDYTASSIAASDARYSATISQASRFGAIIAQTFTYRGGVR